LRDLVGGFELIFAIDFEIFEALRPHIKDPKSKRRKVSRLKKKKKKYAADKNKID
jgi:hypothetical protein